MENTACGLGAALFLYGLVSLARLVGMARGRGAPGRGEFGACGLLLVVTSAGFYLLVRWLFGVIGLDASGFVSIAVAVALGVTSAAVITNALVERARAQARCEDLEVAVRGALRKIAALDAERRVSQLSLSRALREKEEAEAREAAERREHELDLRRAARG